MPTWTDEAQAWSAVVSIFIAIVSAWFVVAGLKQAARALQAQNRSSDVSSVLIIWDRLDQHWKRFITAQGSSEESFEFGQLIGYYELSCTLFHDQVFTTSAARTLYDHLKEILPVMQEDGEFSRRFSVLQSRPETFENIRWFCNQPRSPAEYRPLAWRFRRIYRKILG